MSDMSDSECRLLREWIALEEPKTLQTPTYFKFCERLAKSIPNEVRVRVFADLRQDLAVEVLRKKAPLVYKDLEMSRI